MTMSPISKPVLVADPHAAQAAGLGRRLRRMGHEVCVVTTANDALDRMRREVLNQAVVAVELALNGKPILARLARLPALECLVAIGPGGDVAMERLARCCGAHVYLPRPVATESLAMALRVPVPAGPPDRPP